MISIVIPLYNKERSIVSTIESVLSQTYKDWECIIVNDGSTDGSADVVRDFIRANEGMSRDISLNEPLSLNDGKPQIRLIQKENGGVSSARNRGIREAKGDYVALLDGDDLWDKEYLAEQVKMVADFPKAAMWGINFAELSDGKLIRKLATALPDGFRGYVENYFQMKGRVSDLFCSSSVLIRQDVFDNVGLFDERIKYAEDSDMWFRIIANYPVAFYDRYMVWYLYDAENRERLLKYWLPYYVDKFKDSLYQQDKVFYRWVMRWAAVRIKQIYFNDPDQHEEAKVASLKLDYSQLPIKYRFELLTPLWFGRMVYKILK